MTVGDVYKRFGVPPNLSEHMLRVAGVVDFIHRNWTGEEIDWNLLTKIALLHDLGNVVKFTWDNYEKFGLSQSEAKSLQQLQQTLIQKYGEDDHEATKKMLEELGVEQIVSQTILDKSFGNSIKTARSNNWYPKILLYSDLRVMPNNISTLDERIQDIHDRYPKYRNRVDFSELVRANYEIEKEIQEHVSVSLREITQNTIKINEAFLNLNV